MTVYETDIPGVGRKYELPLDGAEHAVVIHHHDGRREVFRRPHPDADSERVFDLRSEQARTLGSILTGAHFESVDTDDLSVPLGDAIIEWVTVDPDAAVAGVTLREATIRTETGASVMAIQREAETLANPDPDETIRPGDILVTLGTRDEQAALATLVGTPSDADSTDTDA